MLQRRNVPSWGKQVQRPCGGEECGAEHVKKREPGRDGVREAVRRQLTGASQVMGRAVTCSTWNGGTSKTAVSRSAV